MLRLDEKEIDSIRTIPREQPEQMPMMTLGNQNQQNELRDSEESEGEGISCTPNCNPGFRKRIKTFFLGQLLSLCLCGTGISSELLAKSGFNAPAAQSFANYFFLFFVYGALLMFRSGEKNFGQVVKKRWWKYMILALIDVQANYLIVWAYQFTNLTSIQVLDCTTIIHVLVISFFFLAARYNVVHIIGVIMSFIGSCFIIYIDHEMGKSESEGTQPLKGDLLVIAATFLYAISNTAEESLVKKHDRSEYLGLVGMFGMIFSACQFVIFERNAFAKTTFTLNTLFYLAGFTIAMFTFYSLVTVVMQRSSALMFNISVLTADFYSLIVGIFFFKYAFNYYYIAAFILTMAGSFVFSIYECKPGPDPTREYICTKCCSCWPWIQSLNEPNRHEYTVRDAEQAPSSNVTNSQSILNQPTVSQ